MTKQLVQNVDRMNVAPTLSRLNMVPNRATRTLPRSVVTVQKVNSIEATENRNIGA